MKEQKTNIKQIILAGLVAVLSFMPSTAMAWGPDRTTYKWAEPADHVTFNSITDNPVVGDERNFVRVREANANEYVNEVTVEPGHEYIVYILYHNDAASAYNSDGSGIARYATVRSQFPTEISKDQRGQITGWVSANNATPASVWDEAYLNTNYDKVTLHFKTGSAVIHNDWNSNGTVLPTTLFEESGTFLGYNTLDGIVPGCAEFSGYITYTIVADEIDATLEKTVSLDGEHFFETVDAKPGDTVTYKVEFKNTGNKRLTNVTFKDVLPEGLTLVSGTTTLYNTTHPDGEKMTDLIASNGYNLGLYGPNTYATMTYQAKVDENTSCAALVNKITVSHDDGEMSDGATVTVGDCMPNEIPSTGPAEIVLLIVVIGGMGTGMVYYIRSRKQLREIEKGL